MTTMPDIDNALHEAVRETRGNSAFDAGCKRILSERVILARIMKECLPEFRDCTYEEIASDCIKDDPLIESVPLRPAPLVRGVRNDESDPLDGEATYDIRFVASVPGEEAPIGLVINVEAQGRSTGLGYPLLRRAAYYCARMVASQYGETFTGASYGDLRKVYSIWVCLEPPAGMANTISRYEFERHDLVGSCGEDVADCDIMAIVVIRLGGPGSAGYDGILGLLGTLLSRGVGDAEKYRVLADEYGIEPSTGLERGVGVMSSLDEYYFDQLRAELEPRLREELTAKLREEFESRMREELRVRMREELETETREELRVRVREETQAEVVVDSARRLMANLGLDADGAFDALGIPEGDRPKYRELLAE